jgi:hypothetical protein
VLHVITYLCCKIKHISEITRYKSALFHLAGIDVGTAVHAKMSNFMYDCKSSDISASDVTLGRTESSITKCVLIVADGGF